jgi:hypothetical protein
VKVAEERKNKNNSPAIKEKEKSGRNSQGPSAFV